jgi:uncharacterized protein YhbP (UPF0306 family)
MTTFESVKIIYRVENRISEFITHQTVLTLATVNETIPYCASCFYSFIPTLNYLVIKSDATSNHITEAINNPSIAAAILPDKLEIGKIRGIQLTGKFIIPENEQLTAAKKSYYKKYPFAIAIPGDLWIIELEYIKFTDNTLGFGKKLIWNK